MQNLESRENLGAEIISLIEANFGAQTVSKLRIALKRIDPNTDLESYIEKMKEPAILSAPMIISDRIKADAYLTVLKHGLLIF